MDWHKIVLTAQQLENDEHGKLQEQFRKLYGAANQPEGMALLKGNLLAGSKLTDKVYPMYFSPGSENYCEPIFQRYADQIESCNEPDPSELLLLEGAL